MQDTSSDSTTTSRNKEQPNELDTAISKTAPPSNASECDEVRTYDTVSDVVESKVHQCQQNSDA